MVLLNGIWSIQRKGDELVFVMSSTLNRLRELIGSFYWNQIYQSVIVFEIYFRGMHCGLSLFYTLSHALLWVDMRSKAYTNAYQRPITHHNAPQRIVMHRTEFLGNAWKKPKTKSSAYPKVVFEILSSYFSQKMSPSWSKLNFFTSKIHTKFIRSFRSLMRC